MQNENEKKDENITKTHIKQMKKPVNLYIRNTI